MATKEQKQELVDILKFTPIKVTLSLQGYGGECFAGTVDRKIYDYFANRRLDISEYASDGDYAENNGIPEEMQPFYPGSPYDCDNLFHASGAELSDLNTVTVTDENNNIIWENNLGYSHLDSQGVQVSESGGGELLDLCNEDQIIFWGGNGEKGCFFDAEFILRAPFDPKKLEINFENCDDWYIISTVHYDGEELDGFGGYSTTGKWTEHKWVLLNDEQVYDPLDEEESDLSDIAESNWNPAEELDKIWDEQKTEWFDVSINPQYQGTYECQFESTTWPFPIERMCEWTGRSWKENSKKAIGIKQWRGLKVDPNAI